MANQARVSNGTYKTLRTFSLKYQFELNRQVSMGEIISAALQIAEKHTDEFVQVLKGNKTGE